MSKNRLLEVYELTREFKTRIDGRRTNYIKAVDDVSFELESGESLGITGRSGSGKTTLVRLITGVLPPNYGRILYSGIDMFRCSVEERKRIRRKLGVVYQDPVTSVDPRMQIADIIAEPLVHHLQMKGNNLEKRIGALFDSVELSRLYSLRYPHQLSIGELQRVCIARALALEPELVLFDEATSAIDSINQQKLVDLILALRAKFALSYIYVSHNLALLAVICDSILVMERGRIVERGRLAEVLRNPSHRSTQELVESIPRFPM